MTTGAVILGAGFSRRFGADKRLQPLNGQTVAECTVQRYAAAFERVRVVVRDDDQRLRQALSRFELEIIVSLDAHLGMGHSLADGFSNLPWDWAFVGLLDMPYIEAGTLHLLIEAAAHSAPDQIIRPRLTSTRTDDGQPGHPIGWPQMYFGEIQACHGDTGARALLTRHADHILDVEVDDPGIIRDIDRPEDLTPD